MLEQSVTFMPAPEMLSTEPYDLVIVGAGILGLAHAWHALRLGLRTAVVERDGLAVGASVRNFGHIGVAMQSGDARRYAEIARGEWITLGGQAGFDVHDSGTTVVLRNELEMAVMAEYAEARGGGAAAGSTGAGEAAGEAAGEVELLSAEQTAGVLGVDPSLVHGGAHLAGDLRVDSPTAVAAIARHLEAQGVDFFYGTNVGAVAPGTVTTSRGELSAKHIVVAVNHDLDRFFPQIADAYAIERCRLRMLEIDAPRNVRIDPAVLTGLSLLRYDGFRALPSHDALQAHFVENKPELLEHDLNHMLTQRPDGVIVVGDTHHRERTEHPFELERSDELLLTETARLFGVDRVRVRRRWRGIYASSALTNFVCETPMPTVRAASVTTGIGMTTALGFALDSLTSLLESTTAIS